MKCAAPARLNKRDKTVIALAYFHRYGWIVPCFAAAYAVRRIHGASAIVMGLGALVFAVWTFFGYRLKWRHVYCSYQDAYHQKMTPRRIRWHEVKKSDAYGVPLFFAGVGAALLLAAVFGK